MEVNKPKPIHMLDEDYERKYRGGGEEGDEPKEIGRNEQYEQRVIGGNGKIKIMVAQVGDKEDDELHARVNN